MTITLPLEPQKEAKLIAVAESHKIVSPFLKSCLPNWAGTAPLIPRIPRELSYDIMGRGVGSADAK
jgi:hypothetical protein